MTDALSATVATIPDVRPRPPLDRWLRDRSMTSQDAARRFGCTKQMVDYMRRPFADPDRKTPGRDLLTRIVRETNGGLRPEDFHPPVEAILRGEAA